MKHSIYDNIICAKFDGSLDHPITMYDNLPYKRDSDYCNAEKLTLQSDKIIKYYLCINETEKYLIDNRDDEIEAILANIKEQESARIQITEQEVKVPETQDGITPEQIQSLLTDPEADAAGQEMPDEDGFSDSFADVEDW